MLPPESMSDLGQVQNLAPSAPCPQAVSGETNDLVIASHPHAPILPSSSSPQSVNSKTRTQTVDLSVTATSLVDALTASFQQADADVAGTSGAENASSTKVSQKRKRRPSIDPTPVVEGTRKRGAPRPFSGMAIVLT